VKGGDRACPRLALDVEGRVQDPPRFTSNVRTCRSHSDVASAEAAGAELYPSSAAHHVAPARAVALLLVALAAADEAVPILVWAHSHVCRRLVRHSSGFDGVVMMACAVAPPSRGRRCAGARGA
jgi:hypothetical protein